MSPNVPARACATVCFPRVSGDEPQCARPRVRDRVFSPRERG